MDVRRLVDEDCRQRGFPPLDEQLAGGDDPVNRLRAEIRLAERDLCPWQDSIVGIVAAIADAGLAVTADKAFLWRYVTSINLSTARQLLDHLDRGCITTTLAGSVNTGQFDLVVTAAGFAPPALYHRQRELHFGQCPSNGLPVTRLDRDLRLILSDTREPERIWAVGPASGIRIPFANFLHTAARQARHVAHQIACDRECTQARTSPTRQQLHFAEQPCPVPLAKPI
ncbi:hypothetical protein [Burkholderia sola]|uniref:hypothetical protein n=1 Tax=Burkholderia sola TaxID=2843302 RepID=UPI0033905E77